MKYTKEQLKKYGIIINTESPSLKILEYTPTFEEISKQMRINVDILKKEISEHIDKELERFRKGINNGK